MNEDVRFYIRLIEQLRPARVLELASGSGRVTLPLARLAARLGFDIVGVDLAEPMIAEAERKRAQLSPEAQRRVAFVKGDIREWAADAGFDLIITPCSSLSHLMTLDDQVAAWSRAKANLVPGGRFVADVTVPDPRSVRGIHADTPASAARDRRDTRDPRTGARLLRYKTTRYLPHEQRAEIRFLYDKFPRATRPDALSRASGALGARLMRLAADSSAVT